MWSQSSSSSSSCGCVGTSAGVVGVAESEVVLDIDNLLLALTAEVGYSGRAIIEGFGIKSNPRDVAVVATISPDLHDILV